ncbi:MAG: signal peptidase II, partial [Brevundimonas sp.]|nr:signal peptidase II [Brevundimonas sp.]
MKIPRIALAAYGFALLIIVVDQLTKAWVLSGLDLREMRQVPVWPPIFNFTWVENRGVSFGLFGDGSARWMLSGFSVVVAGILGWWALKADRRLLVSAIGLIMGGAIGNVIDRIRFGFVVDFLDFSG